MDLGAKLFMFDVLTPEDFLPERNAPSSTREPLGFGMADSTLKAVATPSSRSAKIPKNRSNPGIEKPDTPGQNTPSLLNDGCPRRDGLVLPKRTYSRGSVAEHAFPRSTVVDTQPSFRANHSTIDSGYAPASASDVASTDRQPLASLGPYHDVSRSPPISATSDSPIPPSEIVHAPGNTGTFSISDPSSVPFHGNLANGALALGLVPGDDITGIHPSQFTLSIDKLIDAIDEALRSPSPALPAESASTHEQLNTEGSGDNQGILTSGFAQQRTSPPYVASPLTEKIVSRAGEPEPGEAAIELSTASEGHALSPGGGFPTTIAPTHPHLLQSLATPQVQCNETVGELSGTGRVAIDLNFNAGTYFDPLSSQHLSTAHTHASAFQSASSYPYDLLAGPSLRSATIPKPKSSPGLGTAAPAGSDASSLLNNNAHPPAELPKAEWIRIWGSMADQSVQHANALTMSPCYGPEIDRSLHSGGDAHSATSYAGERHGSPNSASSTSISQSPLFSGQPSSASMTPESVDYAPVAPTCPYAAYPPPPIHESVGLAALQNHSQMTVAEDNLLPGDSAKAEATLMLPPPVSSMPETSVEHADVGSSELMTPEVIELLAWVREEIERLRGRDGTRGRRRRLAR
ncbi:hypothetical protein PYCCODRAFT_1480332 [Trametes coccinea BRFM310]|uniref:Uncharacterized protein n=1 Tax=Trametes coccinea (strain BRFM310) TaxID=1353009 RepID=A0A1Y2IE19_TRAC3|nr:hypothetical protein PYCCODRAFT_1480332 [Trametes coccinea BRFM310]